MSYNYEESRESIEQKKLLLAKIKIFENIETTGSVKSNAFLLYHIMDGLYNYYPSTDYVVTEFKDYVKERTNILFDEMVQFIFNGINKRPLSASEKDMLQFFATIVHDSELRNQIETHLRSGGGKRRGSRRNKRNKSRRRKSQRF